MSDVLRPSYIIVSNQFMTNCDICPNYYPTILPNDAHPEEQLVRNLHRLEEFFNEVKYGKETKN